MNTFNEFELNRIKKFYADELASRLQRSKSSKLAGNQQQQPEHYHYKQRQRTKSASRANESLSVERLTGGRHFPGQLMTDLETAAAMASPRTQAVVDLKRYEHALLSKRTSNQYRRSRSASGGAGTSLPSRQFTSSTSANRRGKFGRALYDFQAKTDSELSLQRGDLVEMIELLDDANDWARVEDCQSGLTGLVPVSYIDFTVGCAVARRDVHASAGGDQRPTTCALANTSTTSGSRRSAPILPMSKGEPITLFRKLSGHWYEASNTKQVKGLVWSNDLDIIKQPAVHETADDDHLVQSHGQYSRPIKVTETRQQDFHRDQDLADDFTDDDDDDDEYGNNDELLVMDSHGDHHALTMRRARSCSGCGPSKGCDCGSGQPQHLMGGCCGQTMQGSSSSHPNAACPQHGSHGNKLIDQQQWRHPQRQAPLNNQAPRRSSSSPYISTVIQQQESGRGFEKKASRSNHQLPRLCKARFAYEPRQKDELELVPGEILVVVHECDDGWFIGSSYSTNQTGTFPGNFVEFI